ncbi:hypothetical protein VP01_11180g1, partial [Puccinia sorghi]
GGGGTFDTDELKLSMKKLFKRPVNVKYDRNLPVYIHPTNCSPYFILSHATW